MNEVLQKILAFCEERVSAFDIYVWGGSGQKSSAITEAWIRQKEAKNQNGAHADQAVQTWMERVSAGKCAFRAYDCSGYVSAALLAVGVLDKRRDCDGLYALCDDLAAPQDGALLFRVNTKDPNDETHVGIYFEGYQYHAKGREDGVVKEPYEAAYWAKIAWFSALKMDASTSSEDGSGEADQIDPPYVQITGSVNVRFPAGKDGKIIYVAHDEKLPFEEFDDDTGWWGVLCPKGPGFVSCDIPRYAQLIKE